MVISLDTGLWTLDRVRVPDLDPVEPPANPELELDPNSDDSTVGTGSVLAIGCSLIVLLILIFGVALFVSRQMN